MNTINHIIGTAIKKTKFSTPAYSVNGNQRPVRTTANTPETSVARWLFTCPINEQTKFPKYNVNGRFLDIKNGIEKGNYCSAVTSTVAVDVLVSDCKI